MNTVRFPVTMALLLVVVLLLGFSALKAQQLSGIVNEYAKVLLVDTCDNTILVDNASAFTAGDRVLIIQMKGASVDTTNTPNYGQLKSMGAAGLYEYTYVASVNVLTITLRQKLANLYDPSQAVQIVKVPQYQSATIVDTIRSRPWDGNSGGIVALEIFDTLYLNSAVDVSRQGFIGGFVSTHKTSPAADKVDYHYPGSSGDGGYKGEGISNPYFTYEAGRGAQYNGGGGGNNQNAGGGGGSNGGGGGKGGKQESSLSQLDIGGIGGYVVDYTTYTSRLFMGGGGGGGQENDPQGTSGATGGGLIIIRARIIQPGSSAALISNGGTAALAGADGAGGGGAGGTIAVSASQINGAIHYEAKGGNGGDNDANHIGGQNFCYAPGGGGGGGRIYVSGSTKPAATVTLGKAGIVTFAQLPCFGTTYGATDGTDGIIQTGFTPFDNTNQFGYPKAISHADTICIGDTAVLGINGGNSFAWTPTAGLDNPTAQNPKASPSATTQYIANYKDSRGCSFADTVVVTVHLKPSISLSGPKTVCGGDIASYGTSALSNTTFTWTVTGGTIVSPANSESITIQWDSTATSGRVFLTAITAGKECPGIDSVLVTVNPVVKPLVSGTGTYCGGDTAVLTVSPSNTFASYSWSTGENTQSIRVTASGKYVVTCTMPGGCTILSDTIPILFNPKPQPLITPAIYALPDSGGVDSLFVSGGNFVSYNWSTGQSGDSIEILDSGLYTVTVTDSNGCTATTSIQIVRDLSLPFVIIAMDTIVANPGDVINFPIKIVYSRNLPPSGATDWISTISFNHTLMAPINTGTQSTTTGETRTLNYQGVRPVPLELGPLQNPITYVAALGDTSETVVSVDLFDFTNGRKPLIIKHNGLLKINVCTAGGERLYSEDGKIRLGQSHPNPASTATTIDVDLREDGKTVLLISDMLGRTVRTLANGEYKKGHYTFDVDLHDLSKGSYLYVLQTPTAVQSKILTVEH